MKICYMVSFDRKKKEKFSILYAILKVNHANFVVMLVRNVLLLFKRTMLLKSDEKNKRTESIRSEDRGL